MLTPIRCVIQITSNLLGKLKDESHRFDLQIIFNTASFLLNQVQGNLDQSLLNQDKLTSKLSDHELKQDVI